MAKRKDYGLTSKSRSKASHPKEPTTDPRYEKDESRFVSDSRRTARREFTDALQDNGASNARTYARATVELTKKMFRSGTPPEKKRDDWPIDDQKRIAVGERRVARNLYESSSYDDDSLIENVRHSGREVNGDINRDGVDSWFDKLFRPKTIWEEMAEEKTSRNKQSKPDDDDDDDDDNGPDRSNPYMTEGAKKMMEARAKNDDDDPDPVVNFIKSFNLFG